MAFQTYQITTTTQFRTHTFQKQQKMAGRKKLFGSAVHMLSGGLGGGLGGTFGGNGLGGGTTGLGF